MVDRKGISVMCAFITLLCLILMISAINYHTHVLILYPNFFIINLYIISFFIYFVIGFLVLIIMIPHMDKYDFKIARCIGIMMLVLCVIDFSFRLNTAYWHYTPPMTNLSTLGIILLFDFSMITLAVTMHYMLIKRGFSVVERYHYTKTEDSIKASARKCVACGAMNGGDDERCAACGYLF